MKKKSKAVEGLKRRRCGRRQFCKSGPRMIATVAGIIALVTFYSSCQTVVVVAFVGQSPLHPSSVRNTSFSAKRGDRVPERRAPHPEKTARPQLPFANENSSKIARQRSRQLSGRSGRRVREDVIRELDMLDSSSKVYEWVTQNINSPQAWSSWSTTDQIELLKYLGRRGALYSIVKLVTELKGKQHSTVVKVYTTALFALAAGSSDTTIDLAWRVLDQMDRNQIEPTTVTFTALLRSIKEDPILAQRTMQELLQRYPSFPWDADVYHAAIYSCRLCFGKKQSDTDRSWQTALQLMQQMQRRHRLQPSSKTYLAVLSVLAPTRKIAMIRTVVQQWQSFCSGIKDDVVIQSDQEIRDRIWVTALVACSEARDFCQATRFFNEIDSPNLHHSTALLKVFAGSGKEQLALEALNCMTSESNGKMFVPECEHTIQLPRVNPDLVTLNTVILACSKAGNVTAAEDLFVRIQRGEFNDPDGQPLSPDRITYHSLLSSCENPETVKRLVNDMRLSRRHRYGAIPPTSSTYELSLVACQRSKSPDMKIVDLLLKWSKDDGIVTSKSMYSAAIWTAQGCHDYDKCMAYYKEMDSSGLGITASAMNGILVATCEKGELGAAMNIFDLTRQEKIEISYMAMSRLVSVIRNTSTSRDEEGEKLNRILSQLDPQERTVATSSSLFEALIKLYGSRKEIDRVTQVVDQISGFLNASCLRAILLAYSKCSVERWNDAVELLHTSDITAGAPGPGLIDQLALSYVILACSRADQFDEALSLLQLYGIEEQDLPPKAPKMFVGAFNALISSAGRGGCPEISLAVLNEMKSRFGVARNLQSYKCATIACNQAQHASKIYGDQADEEIVGNEEVPLMDWWEIGLGLLQQMKNEGLNPDVHIYSSVISACEAAGQWQRALGVLQSIIDEDTENTPSLNLYCWNAAISACEKGGAWVEALDLYERMLESETISPNVVTMNSLLEALDKNGQKELALSKYMEGLELGIVDPWSWRKDGGGGRVLALDFHQFSAAMTKAALRNVMDTWLDEADSTGGLTGDLVIITGKGLRSAKMPVLQQTVIDVLAEYGIKGKVDEMNSGRVIVDIVDLLSCFGDKSF